MLIAPTDRQCSIKRPLGKTQTLQHNRICVNTTMKIAVHRQKQSRLFFFLRARFHGFLLVYTPGFTRKRKSGWASEPGSRFMLGVAIGLARLNRGTLRQ
jgi:hypothetical protein